MERCNRTMMTKKEQRKKIVTLSCCSIFLLMSFSVRMADYAPAWGPRCNDGGFQFSEVLHCYKSTDVCCSFSIDNWYNCLEHRYLKQLIAFSYNKAGNIGNLSRIDPLKCLIQVKFNNFICARKGFLESITSSK